MRTQDIRTQRDGKRQPAAKQRSIARRKARRIKREAR